MTSWGGGPPCSRDHGFASANTFYCYDARNQLTNAAAAAGCASPTETYTYDDAGNRLSALAAGATRTFAYTTDGQLSSCTNPSCTVTHDSAGRLTQLTDGSATWTYEYDSEGRLTLACNASSCAGTPARVEFTYDGEGHRTKIVATTAGTSPTVTTTDVRYQGDRVAAEVTGSISRDFTTDESGVIRKMVVTGGADAGTYLPVWNGHGDLTALWRVNADGSLTLANSVTFTTWGRPSVTTHNGIGDLAFRYLYVGASDVHWDDAFWPSEPTLKLGLLYMHARRAIDHSRSVYSDDGPLGREAPVGLVPDERSWDRSDISLVPGSAVVVVTERIWDLARSEGWTNVELTPAAKATNFFLWKPTES